MREWFCVVGGTRYGPISEEVLKQWIAEGRLKADDLVWTVGMAEWIRAAAVPGLFASYPVPASSMSGIDSPGGTGGMTANRDLMAQAREILRGRWGEALVFALLYGLLTIGIQIVPYAGGCAMLILGGAFALGFACFWLAFTRRGPHELGMMFRGFRQFGNALGAYLLQAIFVLGLMVAAAVPGAIIGLVAGLVTNNLTIGLVVGGVLAGIPAIVMGWIMGLGYAMTYYLLADNPALGALEPIMQSWRMMRGFKGKLFCLNLRFIGWALLCILTCGIGFLWLVPYMQVSFARFYDDLRPAAASATALAPQSMAPVQPFQPVQPAPGV
jgi:uncharacterized membrane protein